jgi:hypothetical protein
MPTATYTPLAEITLTGSSALISFSSINQGYRDLILVGQIKTSAGRNATVTVNSDTTFGNYSYVYMWGDGSSSGSSANGSVSNVPINYRSQIYDTAVSSFTMNFMDYSTNKQKSIIYRYDRIDLSNGYETIAAVSRWHSTSAITSIEINANSTGFAAGTTMALYGVIS